MSTKKTGLTTENLTKGLSALESLAAGGAQSEAVQGLLAKAQAGSITPEERAELVKSLSAGDLTTRATEALGGEAIRKSVDVSDYLRESHRGMLTSLSILSDEIQKSQNNTVAFNKALAVTMVEMGEVLQAQGAALQSMQKSLDTWGAQPAAAPKGRLAGAAPLEKSFAGVDPKDADGNKDQLTKAQVSDAFSSMLEKGLSVVGGEEVLRASVKFETTGAISKSVLDEVSTFVKSNGKAA